MIKKIIACADIHIPMLKGISEKKEILKTFLNQCREIVEEEGKDNVRIAIAGDIFNQKIAVTNESNLCVNWFFEELNKICKTVIIAGNHDFAMNNTARIDSLTPLFEIGNYENIIFLDKELNYTSGCYVDDNVVWCVYSSFTGFTTPDINPTKEIYPNATYVGLVHGEINGAITVTNYVSENGLESLIFEDCDFVIAGHIHKRQEIKKNGVPIVYCSSIEQKDFGESVYGHGFVVWDIEDTEDYTYEYVDVPNPNRGFYKFEICSANDIAEDNEELINY